MVCVEDVLHRGHNPCFYGINFAIGMSVKTKSQPIPATILVFMELTLQY
nr:hypothetical protein [Methanobrevibacter oralis]